MYDREMLARTSRSIEDSDSSGQSKPDILFHFGIENVHARWPAESARDTLQLVYGLLVGTRYLKRLGKAESVLDFQHMTCSRPTGYLHVDAATLSRDRVASSLHIFTALRPNKSESCASTPGFELD